MSPAPPLHPCQNIFTELLKCSESFSVDNDLLLHIDINCPLHPTYNNGLTHSAKYVRIFVFMSNIFYVVQLVNLAFRVNGEPLKRKPGLTLS